MFKRKLLKIYPNIGLIQDFVFDSIRKCTRPKVIVDYLRTPYVSDFDSNFRLTFDRSLTVTQTNECYEIYVNRVWYKMIAGYTILEVKFLEGFHLGFIK